MIFQAPKPATNPCQPYIKAWQDEKKEKIDPRSLSNDTYERSNRHRKTSPDVTVGPYGEEYRTLWVS